MPSCGLELMVVASEALAAEGRDQTIQGVRRRTSWWCGWGGGGGRVSRGAKRARGPSGEAIFVTLECSLEYSLARFGFALPLATGRSLRSLLAIRARSLLPAPC